MGSVPGWEMMPVRPSGRSQRRLIGKTDESLYPPPEPEDMMPGSSAGGRRESVTTHEGEAQDRRTTGYGFTPDVSKGNPNLAVPDGRLAKRKYAAGVDFTITDMVHFGCGNASSPGSISIERPT